MSDHSTTAPPPGALDPHDTAFFGLPRGLSTLFFTEMWERFSYYGGRALLILFMTASLAEGGLGMDAATAAPIYGIYVARRLGGRPAPRTTEFGVLGRNPDRGG